VSKTTNTKSTSRPAAAPARLAELTKRGASNQFRALVDEMKLLLDLFPHIRDSYDADELPLSFIMKRDARRSDAARMRASRRAKRR
jgi:hypothetical protein